MPGTNPIFDRLAAGLGLLILSPALALISAAIAMLDRRPVLFRQKRLGRNGEPFELIKFRSMAAEAADSGVTAAADPRVTRVGRILRKYKLDELPQLWNVLRGDMRLVGPRPEVPHLVDLQNPAWQRVLAVRPGITDLASLIYRNEEELLAGAPDVERYYRDTVQPHKLALNLRYIETRNLSSDLAIILLSIRFALWPKQFNAERIMKSFPKRAPIEP
jgi:lipopolysaccharide/colanic/teichoic acid biosynthesis glycosyltransferase